MDRSILKTGIPAAVVVSVLAGGGGDRAVASTNLGSMVYGSAVSKQFRNPTPR
jgi:hypothetical protein